ncbi:MAG: type II toxin-antitoxin system VapC family toxin [Myxococcaceae bacterium]
MRVALDTNRYTDFCRGDERAVEVISTAEQLWMPLIVLAELRAGYAHGSRREANERTLTRFLNSERVRVVAPDEQTTFIYADLYSGLRKRGRPVPTNDLWIAALVTQHDLVLFDRDSDFDAFARLARI